MGDDQIARGDRLDVVVGRQPIFDRRRNVVAYELLFRHLDREGVPDARTGDLMTAEVIFGSVALGLERLVGRQLAFVNADRGLLTSPDLPVLPPERVVLEVLEHVEPDAEVLAGCERLVAAGYRLALDDFVWFDGAPALLELASIVKIDLLRVEPGGLAELVERCRPYGVRLLAEKVEKPSELADCLDLGFEYFQGYLLARPETVAGRGLGALGPARLRLVAALVCTDCEFDEVEAAVAADPAIAHQLISLAGIGAADGTRRAVRTLREAIVLTGLARMRAWAALLLLVDRTAGSDERSTRALARARLAELLAQEVEGATPSLAFTAGMVSAFELLLGAELEAILDELPVAAELRDAALGGDSPVGRVVADVVDYERGCRPVGVRTGLAEYRLHSAWAAAMTWAVAASGGWDVSPGQPGSAPPVAS